jgi:hypothetical protein
MRLHGDISKKAVLLILAALKTSKENMADDFNFRHNTRKHTREHNPRHFSYPHI